MPGAKRVGCEFTVVQSTDSQLGRPPAVSVAVPRLVILVRLV